MKMTKEDKAAIYLVAAVPAVIFVFAFLFYTCWHSYVEHTILKGSAGLTFSGKVDSLYCDRNTKTLVLESGFLYRLYDEWEDLVEKGDSLVKVSGSLELLVYKKDKADLVLNYLELAKAKNWKLNW